MAPEGTSNDPGSNPNARESGDKRVSAGQGHVPASLKRLAQLISTSPHNLVSRSERDEVLRRHVLECDALASLLTPAGRWMDLGTGGGLPGLVLAFRHPDVRWTLLDATAKKVAAVVAFAQDLNLTNVDAVAGRAEWLAHESAYRGEFAGVVTRAVAPLAVLTELCRGFLRPDGLLVALKGPAWQEELQAAAGALRVLRLSVVSTERLPVSVRDSWVVTMRAHGTPPAGFPRRDGLPKADPLR